MIVSGADGTVYDGPRFATLQGGASIERGAEQDHHNAGERMTQDTTRRGIPRHMQYPTPAPVDAATRTLAAALRRHQWQERERRHQWAALLIGGAALAVAACGMLDVVHEWRAGFDAHRRAAAAVQVAPCVTDAECEGVAR